MKKKRKPAAREARLSTAEFEALERRVRARLDTLMKDLDATRDVISRRNDALDARDPEGGVAELVAQLAVFMAWAKVREIALMNVPGFIQMLTWADGWSTEYVELGMGRAMEADESQGPVS